MTLIPPQQQHSGAARVEMLNFSKRFGALQALDDVSMIVEAGAFHALLGENGAGKSTLVKALIGFYSADTGSVMVDGREQAIHSPRDAAALGLGMIFQHFTVVPGMTVAEGRLLLAELLEHATHPSRVWRHEWRLGDLVMWDNRTTLHRGRRYDLSEPRELRRTTTMDYAVCAEAAA